MGMRRLRSANIYRISGWHKKVSRTFGSPADFLKRLGEFEWALHASPERFKTIFHDAHDGWALCLARRRPFLQLNRLVNSAAEAMLGRRNKSAQAGTETHELFDRFPIDQGSGVAAGMAGTSRSRCLLQADRQIRDDRSRL